MRDVIVCHCTACREATGGPWAASAAYRRDLVVEDESTLTWELAAVSEHDASRGRCRACGTVVFWDAPGCETVSFAAALLRCGAGALDVAVHIWVAERDRETLTTAGVPVEPKGLPASLGVHWHA